MKIELLKQKLAEQKARSQWDKAVKYYAEWVIQDAEDPTKDNATEMLNAFDFVDYPVTEYDIRANHLQTKQDRQFFKCKRASEGCNYLVYNNDILPVLYTKSDRKYRLSYCIDHCIEDQARAVFQACLLLNRLIAEENKGAENV